MNSYGIWIPGFGYLTWTKDSLKMNSFSGSWNILKSPARVFWDLSFSEAEHNFRWFKSQHLGAGFGCFWSIEVTPNAHQRVGPESGVFPYGLFGTGIYPPNGQFHRDQIIMTIECHSISGFPKSWDKPNRPNDMCITSSNHCELTNLCNFGVIPAIVTIIPGKSQWAPYKSSRHIHLPKRIYCIYIYKFWDSVLHELLCWYKESNHFTEQILYFLFTTMLSRLT